LSTQLSVLQFSTLRFKFLYLLKPRTWLPSTMVIACSNVPMFSNCCVKKCLIMARVNRNM